MGGRECRVGGQGHVGVHFQSCTGLSQHGGGRRFFVVAAVFFWVSVYGLQENLMNDWSCAVRVQVLDLVGVGLVCLLDSMLLQCAALLELLGWSAESRDDMKSLNQC